jgi:hypothetical protein
MTYRLRGSGVAVGGEGEREGEREGDRGRTEKMLQESGKNIQTRYIQFGRMPVASETYQSE